MLGGGRSAPVMPSLRSYPRRKKLPATGLQLACFQETSTVGLFKAPMHAHPPLAIGGDGSASEFTYTQRVLCSASYETRKDTLCARSAERYQVIRGEFPRSNT